MLPRGEPGLEHFMNLSYLDSDKRLFKKKLKVMAVIVATGTSHSPFPRFRRAGRTAARGWPSRLLAGLERSKTVARVRASPPTGDFRWHPLPQLFSPRSPDEAAILSERSTISD